MLSTKNIILYTPADFHHTLVSFDIFVFLFLLENFVHSLEGGGGGDTPRNLWSDARFFERLPEFP